MSWSLIIAGHGYEEEGEQSLITVMIMVVVYVASFSKTPQIENGCNVYSVMCGLVVDVTRKFTNRIMNVQCAGIEYILTLDCILTGIV